VAKHTLELFTCTQRGKYQPGGGVSERGTRHRCLVVLLRFKILQNKYQRFLTDAEFHMESSGSNDVLGVGSVRLGEVYP